MAEDLLNEAKEELKRADHSIYISLKYTRTVDIIKNVIKRLINASDLSIHAMLTHLKEKKKIKTIPVGGRPRAELVAEKLPEFKKFVRFYAQLRDISKASFERKEEYKKNVALVITLRQQRIDVDIEQLKHYYMIVINFLEHVERIVLK